eukprot:SAG11_NODE_44_length_20765_cov_5.183635_20_plen_90_part_00
MAMPVAGHISRTSIELDVQHSAERLAERLSRSLFSRDEDEILSAVRAADHFSWNAHQVGRLACLGSVCVCASSHASCADLRMCALIIDT